MMTVGEPEGAPERSPQSSTWAVRGSTGMAPSAFLFSARWRLSRDCCAASRWNWWRGRRLSRSPGSASGASARSQAGLGIEASPSFVRQPEGNGVAERLIRTLKENLLWVRTFDTIEELRAALVEFAAR